METIVNQIEYLRKEIAARDSQLIFGLIVFASLITASFIAATATGKQLLYRLMVMLLLSGVFYVGRLEYLEKRIVPWLTRAEKIVQTGETKVPKGFLNWEEHLITLKSRWFYLALTDFFCGLAFYWMFCESLRAMFGLEPWLTTEQFLACSGGMLTFAIPWVFIGRWAADK
jgi:hypothetical protein